MHPRRTLLHTLVLAGLVLPLSACAGSTDDAGSADATTQATSAASASTSAAAGEASSPASPSASSSAPAAPAQCTLADLKVSVSDGEGAAGSTYYKVTLTNTSQAPCRTGGFGGISLVGAQGTIIGAPADRTGTGKAAPITLSPGGSAHATLQVAQAESYSPAKCKPTQATGFRVYPPNETRSTVVAKTGMACADAKIHLLTLSPYQAS